MAVGEGGFKQSAFGFDKNEVNEYISNLRKKMQEMESEIKSNGQKTAEAVKAAEEAQQKAKASQTEYSEKITQLEAQVKTERRKFDNLQIQCDDLKRKLRQKGMESAGLVQSSSDASNKQAAEIIAGAEASARKIIDDANAAAKDVVERANLVAKETVDKANAAARETIEKAKAVSGSTGSAVNVDTAAIMSLLQDCLSSLNSEFNSMKNKVSELLSSGGEGAAAPVDIPAFVEASVPLAKFEEAKVPETASAPAPADDNSDSGSMEDFADLLNEMEKNDEPVKEVEPIDTSEHSKAAFDDEFATDLIANTVPSSSLGDDADEDLLAAVREKEQQFAVTPSDGRDDVRDFDMEMSSEPTPDDSADVMKKMLAEAEAAFGNMATSAEQAENDASYDSGDTPSGNEWADLQKQLEAMEKAGNFGDNRPAEDNDIQLDTAEDPKAPDADDSSIWDFGNMDMSDSGDDDMSSDLFGNF